MLDNTAEVLQGRGLIIAPHMDDEVLGCGGALAQLADKEGTHVMYATDGSQSPLLPTSGRTTTTPDLNAIRKAEAQSALGVLGIPSDNMHFLDLPDGRLSDHAKACGASLTELLKRIEPTYVMTPFRYDRHPDHLTVNRVTTTALQQASPHTTLFEYFVYYRWRLLRRGDVRNYIHPDHLIEIDIGAVAIQKRKALACFKSQVTRFYPWQRRPVLAENLLSEVCQNPELFLKYDPHFPGATIFTKAHTWIRLAHHCETPLKTAKDRAVALWHRAYRS
jgi:N-acetylglucosamine malate deacetylase 1